MSSDEEFNPRRTKKKQWKSGKMPVCFDSDNQNDSEPLEDTEDSVSMQTNDILKTSDKNTNSCSDSDDDFNLCIRAKKNMRPLTDSENELPTDDVVAEEKGTELKFLETADKGWESDSSDGQSEKCPICLNKFLGQDIGNPESCDHYFCLDCLLEWAKKVNTCPVDRLPFMLILVREKLQGTIVRRIPANGWKSMDSWLEQQDDDDDSDLTYCEVCGQCNQEDRLLLCDSCDLGYHCECLDPPLENIPVGEWFCPNCDTRGLDECNLSEELMADFQEILRSRFRPRSSIFQPRIIARTSAIETVRHRVQRRREAQLEDIRNSSSSNFNNREKNRNVRKNKRNRVFLNFHVRDRRTPQVITEESPLITSVTKRRFAHRLGLQRTAHGILQSTGLNYSTFADTEQFQDEDASYDSSSDESYLFDSTHGCTSYNNRQTMPHINSSPAKSSSRLRIRVPSPQVSHQNILNEILQTQSLLHSNSQNIKIEKDGSLTLKSSEYTQQRPQNPLQQSTSTDKSKTIPSCSSESSRSEPRLNQWYGTYQANRDSVTNASHSGNCYEDQRSGHHSSICGDKKKEYHQSIRSKDAKSQSEDEVDIYSDIESLGDDIIDDEIDVSTNEQCSIANVYRCDLQLDNMEDDRDSSENELIIDEDAKEEDSQSVEWNEDNSRCSPEEENSQNNFIIKQNKLKFETSGCSNTNIENCEFSKITNFPSQNVCEDKNYDSPNSGNVSSEEILNDDDDDDETINDDEPLENMEHEYASLEEDDEKSNKIETDNNLLLSNDKTQKPDLEVNLPSVNNEEINKINEEESLSSISNEQISVEDSLSSVTNEQIHKLHEEDSLSVSGEVTEKKCSEVEYQEFDSLNKVNFLPESNNFSKNLNILTRCEESSHLIDSRIDESDESISNGDDYYAIKKCLDISDTTDNQDLSKRDLDVNQSDSLSEFNSFCKSPENNNQSMIANKINIEDGENESQDDNINNVKDSKLDCKFKSELVNYKNNESFLNSDENKCLTINEKLNKENIEENENTSKTTTHSILPAEDVEDISEDGSDDTKFKDGSDDWEIDQVYDEKLDDTSHHYEVSEKQFEEVEERVAKLFGSEYSEQVQDKDKQDDMIYHGIKDYTGTKSHSYEDEREEGEIVEEVPIITHRSRSRKLHHRDSTHQEELEDYGDHAPRINISDLPRIPKIKRENKTDIPEETNVDPKRTSVLSRVDSGNNEISWKKLSRSTRERSYRDGRPKDNKLLFREREIKQKLKKDEEKSKKEEDTRRKDDKYKRSENDKWREKTDHERVKDRREKSKDNSHDKSEKKLEREWKIDKFDDKKELKEKFYEKSYRDEKNHRDKHKHKHRENKDHKSEKDKFQEKHTHVHHSREREHSKQKDRKSKKTDIDKKEIRKEKSEKSIDKKGNKHEKRHDDEGHLYYDHRRKDGLPYPEVTAIESKEIYAKGDSIIINVNFNRNTDHDQINVDDIKNIQKDVKKTKLKDKYLIDQRADKLDSKHGKQKHFSDLEESEMSFMKHQKNYERKKSTEKVHVGEMLWKETEENIQAQDISKCNTDCDDSNNLDNFEGNGSPISDISDQDLEKESELCNDVLSPYNDKNMSASPAVSYESPKQRSPLFPSPPSPTENDSYDPCVPTRSPFLQQDSPSIINNYSADNKPKPPPSPELPPLPLEPEPMDHSPQDKDPKLSCLIDKTNIKDMNSSDIIPIATPVSCSSLCPSQTPQFTLPNVKIPPPNYIPQSSNLASNSTVHSLLPNIQNWNVGNTHIYSHNNQPLMQGNFIPPHLSQGNVVPAGTIIPPSMNRLVPAQHVHSTGQVMTQFMPTIPNIRVPPPINAQIAVNLNQQSHLIHPFLPNQVHLSEGQLPPNVSSSAKKSTPDVTEVVDMEVDSPYNSPTVIKTNLQPSPTKNKFDMLASSSKTRSQLPSAEKRHHDKMKILTEKVKQSHLLSKTVINALDRINKKIANKLEASGSNAKRSKLVNRSETTKVRHSRSETTKSSAPPKKDSKSSEKKEIMIRMDESQLTILEDLPSSAVEMQVKEKFLKKLNRQERVVEEVKLALKPYYSRREIDKEEYKEIMRKSVPKVCHNRSGDINPVKIKTLIEGYIKKFKHQQKKSGKLQKTKIS
ncbi:uncharacterized protein [Centruroides vittatus]|uniref:uncharacterized protein isoform X2 n=1 Tax=Centruroides vittatus TaxID=120091 RepID=UPI003510B3E5